jgi:methylornithine synthase
MLRTPALGIQDLLERSVNGETLSLGDISTLLSLTDSEDMDSLFSAARMMRERYFGNRVFCYGFVYFSTYCRNSCNFCFYRCENEVSPRYRKNTDEIVETATAMAESGVHCLDLTSGEDPLFFSSSLFEPLVELVKDVAAATGLPVMVSPGVVPHSVMKELRSAGADWYACYQETHDRNLFSKLRPGQDFDSRRAARSSAASLSMHVEDGLLLGAGESIEERADSLLALQHGGAHQVRVMGFVPQDGTPMSRRARLPREEELVAIAVLRLLTPDRLIPASLDIEGIAGLRPRLDAGANVVTSIIPPGAGLLGVSQPFLGIESQTRRLEDVAECLSDTDLVIGDLRKYQEWLSRT